MNPVLILTHNCLELTKKCVASVQNQDVPTELCIFDNGSTDDTQRWALHELPKDSPVIQVRENFGVSFGWNRGLSYWFENGAQRVLVLNNDTFIPPWFYRRLYCANVPFVTGISVGSMEEIAELPPVRELVQGPDFSAFMISREAWEKIGPFDENMRFYASDNDWHVRAHRAGIKLWNAGIPFYHERSSTLNTAPPKERRLIELQADADRETFKEKYGCYPWGSGYAELLK